MIRHTDCFAYCVCEARTARLIVQGSLLKAFLPFIYCDICFYNKTSDFRPPDRKVNIASLKTCVVVNLIHCRHFQARQKNKKSWEELIAHFPLIRGKYAHNSFVVCFLCRRNVFIEPLPSDDRGYTQTHRLMGRSMKCAVEMSSGVLMYIPSFIKTG
jgi:hypothetical protein